MELRTNAGLTAAAAGLVAAFGIWATAFDGWRTDIIRSLLLEPGADKVAHVIVYGALALLFGLVVERASRRIAWIVGPSLAWVVGFADELRQLGIRGRDASLDDLLANTIGVLVVALVLYVSRSQTESQDRLVG